MKYQSSKIKRYLKKEKISNKHIAKSLSLTEASVSRKIKTGQFFRDEIESILLQCKDKKEGLDVFFPEIKVYDLPNDEQSDIEQFLSNLPEVQENILDKEKE